jgi:hypothetical protein
VARPKTPVEELFWSHVERRDFSDCWLWTGATVAGRGGLRYGKFVVPAGELECEHKSWRLAHRVAFRLAQGHWPEPQALHGCDVGLCCNVENPEHVHEGTAAENTREMFERGRGRLPPVFTGERANRAKLTDVQALEIMEHYAAGGVTQAALAAEYHVSQFAVHYIVTGRRRTAQ